MSKTRLTALLVAAGLGAGVLPAAAASGPPAAPAAAPGAPAVHASPRVAVSASLADLRAEAGSVAAWRTAMVALAAEEGDVAVSASPVDQREFADPYGVGDVDGDGREDVAVLRSDGTVVRSGRDGRPLLRRDEGFLFAVAGAGRVRLLSWDIHFVDHEESFELQQVLQGLDARGRVVWTHEATGSVRDNGVGPAYSSTLDSVPTFMDLGQNDAAGKPAVLMGSLTASSVRNVTRSTLQLTTVSLADGKATELDVVEGTGRGYADAWTVTPTKGAGTCYATVAPIATVARIGLTCDGDGEEWSSLLRLREGYVHTDAGDFDADGLEDLAFTTYGEDEPKPTQVLRGTHVLSRADGSTLGTSKLSNLHPTGGDANRDGEPDFQRVLGYFGEDESAVQGVSLAGEELYRVPLHGSGASLVHLGVDVDGDGVCDALMRTEPRRGEPVTLVVDGRTGRSRRTVGVDGLVWPGLRRAGLDLALVRTEGRRLRTTVLSGDRGRRLMEVVVPGPAGKPSFSAAGSADVDGDRRRDLVVASRTGDQRLTTAFSSSGRLLWQTSERVRPQVSQKGVFFGFGD
jgi:hypothetical protein